LTTDGANSQFWFALNVKYRHEKAVAAALRGKGYVEFLPTCRSQHRSGRRLRDVDLPLFPTYVFCQFDPLHRLPILKTAGVFSIVGTGKALHPVDEEELDAIRAMLKSGLFVEACPYLKIGDLAYVEEGPLKGRTGILQREKNQDRLVVSIHLLQRSVAVEIDRRWLRPLPMELRSR
jgi:transcription antitermination factor NusG